MSLKVKVASNNPGKMDVPGLGLIESDTWVEVTTEQEAAFEALKGMSLLEAHRPGTFDVKSSSSKKETVVSTPASTPKVAPKEEGGE